MACQSDRRYFEADREDIGKQIKEIGGWIKKLDIKNKIFFSDYFLFGTSSLLLVKGEFFRKRNF